MPLITSCQGSRRGLVWHVGSAAPPVDRGDSWSTIGSSEDAPRSGRAEDTGLTWLSRDVAEMRMLHCSPWPCWGLGHGEKDFREAFGLLGYVARRLFGSGVANLWRLAVAKGR
ncbi:hypothetical protein BHM03_00048297 [Ensete ventricosum]|nr:hypothetical protein BHM03_00048297 [Ensete ventricosum]